MIQFVSLKNSLSKQSLQFSPTSELDSNCKIFEVDRSRIKENKELGWVWSGLVWSTWFGWVWSGFGIHPNYPDKSDVRVRLASELKNRVRWELCFPGISVHKLLLIDWTNKILIFHTFITFTIDIQNISIIQIYALLWNAKLIAPEKLSRKVVFVNVMFLLYIAHMFIARMKLSRRKRAEYRRSSGKLNRITNNLERWNWRREKNWTSLFLMKNITRFTI